MPAPRTSRGQGVLYDALEGGEIVMFGELLLVTIMDLKLATSLSTSSRFLPTSRSIIIEGCWEMEQPLPGELHVGDFVPVEAGVDGHLIAAKWVEEMLLEVMVLQFAPCGVADNGPGICV